MKKILLAVAMLAAVPAAHTFAQNATTPAAQLADDKMVAKRQFNSYISMFEAGVSRNTPSVAQDAAMKAMAMMQETISKWSRANAADPKAATPDVKKRIDRANKMYGELKMASVDPIANSAKITPIMKEFMQML